MSKKKSKPYFKFGKYQGEHIHKIIETDPGYVGWCIDQGIQSVIEHIDEDEADLLLDEYRNTRHFYKPL